MFESSMISMLQKINKACVHVIIMSSWPFHVYNLSLGLLVFTLNMIYHTCQPICGMVCLHPTWVVSGTSKESIIIIKYWKPRLDQCEKIPNIAAEDPTATSRNLFQTNGMITIHRWIKSSKGYTFQKHLLAWASTLQFVRSSTSLIWCGILRSCYETI